MMPYGNNMPFGSGMPFGNGMGMGMGYGYGMPFGYGMGMGQGFNPYAFGNPYGVGGGYAPTPVELGWGLGGLRRWGGTYSPQFVTTGLPTDDETVEMIYDAIDADPVVPFDADIDVECDAGTVTLTGTVMSKEIKHAAGDDAWWIPGVDDVHNDLQVVSRRHERTTSHREEEPQPSPRRSRTAAVTATGTSPSTGGTTGTPSGSMRGHR